MMVERDLELAERERGAGKLHRARRDAQGGLLMASRASELAGKRIVVTGGAGLPGRQVLTELRPAGLRRTSSCPQIAGLRPDRTQRPSARLSGEHRPEVVIHLAAEVGGIGANREQPRPLLLRQHGHGPAPDRAARRSEASRSSSQVGTICAYPKFTPGALPGGRPLERLSRGDQRPLRHRQEGAAGPVPGLPRSSTASTPSILLPVNLYGPRDNFDPRDQPRHPGPDPQVRGGPGRGRRHGGALGHRAAPAASSSTSRTPPKPSARPWPSTTTRTR